MSRPIRVIALVMALHLAVLSLVFGPVQLGYLLIAYCSAVVVWGVVFLLGKRRRLAGCIAGVVATVALQQGAYQAMKAELAGPWWPLVQFFAFQYLVAAALSHALDLAGLFGIARCAEPPRGTQPSDSTE